MAVDELSPSGILSLAWPILGLSSSSEGRPAASSAETQREQPLRGRHAQGSCSWKAGAGALSPMRTFN